MRTSKRISLLLAGAFVVLGCSGTSGGPPPPVRLVGPILAERLPATPPGKMSDKKRRFREPAVYVDGQLTGILRRHELPLTLKPRMKKLLDGREAMRFAIGDYLASIGVDIAKVKAVHFHGGRDRVSVIDGDQVRSFKDSLRFSFTQAERGKPRADWPGEGFRINTTIDLIAAMAIYVDKEPPVWDPKIRAIVLDGKKVEGIPYAPAEDLKGTRVYAEGALKSVMKRKTLPDKLLAADSDVRNPKFSLVAYLESVGVDVATARTVEFWVGDDLVARADAKQWQDARNKLEFSIPRRSQGKLMMHFVKGAVSVAKETADDATAKVSAISVYAKATPPQAELAPIPEDSPGSGGGSGQDQGDDENRGDSERPSSAQRMQRDTECPRMAPPSGRGRLAGTGPAPAGTPCGASIRAGPARRARHDPFDSFAPAHWTSRRARRLARRCRFERGHQQAASRGAAAPEGLRRPRG